MLQIALLLTTLALPQDGVIPLGPPTDANG